MKKNTTKKVVVKKAKVIPNDKQIKTLMIEYKKLDKKGFKEGRQIRRKLRRLGHYLSKV